MNQELTDVATALPDGETGERVSKIEKKKPDWINEVLKSPAFVPGVFVTVAVLALFWGLVSKLPALWMNDDGYYTHGFLVPFIAGYVIFRNWDALRDKPVKPVFWLGIFLLPIAWITWAATVADIQSVLSFMLLATILVGVGFVAGWRWMAAVVLPVLYLGWALPVWTGFINNYTNPLQSLSTTIAYHMLQILQLGPYKSDATTILLPHFNLDVGVPCSGLKLVLAISAFTMFFMLIGGLKWWGNVLMVAMILPLCLFINSLRIALIGIVGNAYGPEAGHHFHDYSGYITLILCFVLLFKYARLLGWKD